MNVRQNFGGCPVVGGVEGEDLAIFADDYGAERVLEGSVFAGCDADVEELLHFGEFGDGGCGKLPVLEGFVDVVAGVGRAIAAQDFGCVVGGIEADAEQVRVLVERGVGLQRLVDGGEVAADMGAVIGERTAGVDESHDDDLAAKLLEIDGAIGLVEEREIGNVIAFCGDVVVDNGFVVGARLGDDNDVCEAKVGGAGGIVIGEEGGGDEVAGVELGEDGGVVEAIGHGHRGHQAYDGVVLEGDFAGGGISAEDRAAYGVLLWRAFGDCGGLCRATTAAHSQCHRGHCEKRQDTGRADMHDGGFLQTRIGMSQIP